MRILIVDDQKLERSVIHTLIQRAHDVEVVGEARGGQEAIALTAQLTPDLVVMDIDLPDLDGLSAIPQIHDRHPSARVLILSRYLDDFLVQTAIRKGAKGFVSKSEMTSELVSAMRALDKGGCYYSSSVSHLLAKGNDEPS